MNFVPSRARGGLFYFAGGGKSSIGSMVSAAAAGAASVGSPPTSTLRVPSSTAAAGLTGCGGSTAGLGTGLACGGGATVRGRAAATGGRGCGATARGGVVRGTGRAAVAAGPEFGPVPETGTPLRKARRTSAGRGGSCAAASIRRSIVSSRMSRRSVIRSTRGLASAALMPDDTRARHTVARAAATDTRDTMRGSDGMA